MPRTRASSGRPLTVLWALLVLFMQFTSHAKPVPRPQVIASDGDKVFDMPKEMQRRLNEEKVKKHKKKASNQTMVFGNETHLLRNLSATIGNGTMKYWDKTTIDPDTEEGMRLLRQLSAEASSSLDCTKNDDCSAGFACMLSGKKCEDGDTDCKCAKIVRKVELPPDFILAGFEPLMQLAPFAVTLEADPALNVRYTMDGTEPTRDSPAIRGGDSVAISAPQTILRAFTQANSKYSWKDSKETSAYYTVLVGRHGIGYLVPYYNALPGYSGKLVSVDLDSTRFNQLRVHGIRTDFANYYSEMLRMDTEGRLQVFKAGTGAYMPAKEGQSPESGTELKQLIIRDYSKDARTETDVYGEIVPGNWTDRNTGDYTKDGYGGGSLEDLRGFQGGFTATFSRRTLSYEERISVAYDNRKTLDQCVKYEDGKADRQSTLLKPWMTDDLQKVMYTKAPTPSNPDRNPATDAPTAQPTIAVDYRDACTVTQSDDITSLVKNTTKVQEINYGFLVPFYNGVGYRGTAVRIEMSRTQRTYTETMYQRNTTICCIPSRLFYWGLRSLGYSESENYDATYNGHLRDYCCVNETLNTSSTSHTYYTVDRYRKDQFADSSFKTLDFRLKDQSLVGFAGGFSYGEWAYFVPFFDGYGYGHKVARVHIARFDLDSLQMLDLWDVSTDLAGFFGGFSYLHQSKTNIGPDGEFTYGRAYGYLIPHRNTYGPVGKRNSRLTVDGYTGELVSEGRFSYGGDHLVVKYHGKFVRMNLENEYLRTEADWQEFAENSSETGRKCMYLGVEARGPECIVHPDFDIIDLSGYDPDLRGFSGGFVGGKYGYLAPYKNKIGNAGYFGKLVRIDLERFEVAGVLDLTQNDPSLVGFIGAFLHGNYGILVPHRNDPVSIDRTRGDANYFKHHGQLVRFDLSNELFVEGNFAEKVGNLILTNVSRMQVPDKADPLMRGYANGFACGDYIYLAPHFNNRFHGKFTRVDMRDFDYHVENQFQCTSFQCGFSSVLSNDGSQYINLEESDSQLVGFSGAFPGPGDTPLPVTLLTEGGGDRQSRKYGFKYQSSNAAYDYQKRLVGRVPQHPDMRFHINTTSVVVVGRRLAQICANLPEKYITPYDLCENVYDRTRMNLVDSGLDVQNSPYIVDIFAEA